MSSDFWKTARLALVIIALAAAAYFGARLLNRGIDSTSQSIVSVLSALTHADTHIVEGRAQILSRKEIAELALAELRMSSTRSYQSDSYALKYLPLGTKELIIRGEYRITAGYRLTPGTSLRIEDGIPIADFPDPEILSVELLKYEILSEKENVVNKIDSSERSAVLERLRSQMKTEAEESGILDVVESNVRTRLSDLLGTDQVRVE